MAKCKRCVKRGLLFKVNVDGLCYYCADVVAQKCLKAAFNGSKNENIFGGM